jgi:hypothetical protein
MPALGSQPRKSQTVGREGWGATMVRGDNTRQRFASEAGGGTAATLKSATSRWGPYCKALMNLHATRREALATLRDRMGSVECESALAVSSVSVRSAAARNLRGSQGRRRKARCSNAAYVGIAWATTSLRSRPRPQTHISSPRLDLRGRPSGGLTYIIAFMPAFVMLKSCSSADLSMKPFLTRPA